METVIARFGTAALCFVLTSGAYARDLKIKEIRLHGIGGYSQNRFTLTIRKDGMVQYEGISFVAVEGKRQSKISAENFQRLVRKVEQIRFFRLQDRYNDYPLDKPSSASTGSEVTVEHTFVTDQRTEIVTVVTGDRSKSVEDYMGAPKGLFELEQMVLDFTHAREWTGDLYDRDIPYYDKFPLNTQVSYRVLLQSYYKSSDSKRVAGYSLSFINNKGIDFNVKLERPMGLRKFDGYIVDATGRIKKTYMVEPEFILTELRPVRRYLPVQTH